MSVSWLESLAAGSKKGSGECLTDNLLCLNVVSYVTSFVDASLEKARTGEMPRSSGDQGRVDGSVEYAEFGLIDKSVDEWKHPLVSWILVGL